MRRRPYRSIRLRSRDRDAAIEDGADARVARATTLRGWAKAALWLFFIIPVAFAAVLGLALSRSYDPVAAWAFGLCVAVVMLALPFVVWGMIVRTIRASLAPRPLADIVAAPSIAIALAIILAWQAYGRGAADKLGEIAGVFVGLVVAGVVGAGLGYAYWLFAGRPQPPYD